MFIKLFEYFERIVVAIEQIAESYKKIELSYREHTFVLNNALISSSNNNNKTCEGCKH